MIARGPKIFRIDRLCVLATCLKCFCAFKSVVDVYRRSYTGAVHTGNLTLEFSRPFLCTFPSVRFTFQLLLIPPRR